MNKPKLIIFAGANGSGKTTVAKWLLAWSSVKEFVNADEIARGLSPFNPTGQAVAAGKLVIKRIDDFITKGESFAIETTLSGHAQYRKIRQAKDAGYIIEMHYIFCRDVNINIERVKNRVEQGGHDVPVDDIIRRYRRSLQNIAHYFDVCDIINIYDSSDGYRLIYRKEEYQDALIFDNVLFKSFNNKIIEAKDEH